MSDQPRRALRVPEVEMTADPRCANGHARRMLLKRMRGRRDPCWICELPIDYEAPHHTPLCFEADELKPISRGGSPTDPRNVAAAHSCCNNWRKNKSVETVQAIKLAVRLRFGQWTTPQGFVEMAKALKKAPPAPAARAKPVRGGAKLEW